jgi:4-amino-4-deoxy-L-arabinose transferase-like glycosyltransferase
MGTGLLIAVVLWLCYFSHLDALGFVGPDEPRYAWVARDMAATGDWVTPRLYGKPWFEKPILYYWGAALGYRALGDTEIAARLPSALAAALATLAMGWLALQLYGARTAIATMLILPTSVGMIGFARAATPDMLFSAMLALAMFAAAHSLRLREDRRPTRLSLMLFGAFLGAATLAKGPAAIALAGGSVALWALAARRWRNAFWLAHPWAIAAFSVVALPWYVLCAVRNPEFVRIFLLEHNIERYLTPEFQHEQPFWFFGPILVAGLLPWTILLFGVGRDAWRTWREKKWGDSAGFFFACWVIFPVIFFSLSKSKLPGYVLPAIPPLVLLVAHSLIDALKKRAGTSRWLLAGVAATFVALGLLSKLWLKSAPMGPETGPGSGLWFVLGGIAAASFLMVEVSLRTPTLRGLILPALVVAVLVDGAARQALPELDPIISPRLVARLAGNARSPGESFSAYRIPRAWYYGLNYYLGREIPRIEMGAPKDGITITTPDGLRQLELQSVHTSVLHRVGTRVVITRVGPARR